MKLLIRKFNNTELQFVFILLILIEPDCLSEITWLNNIYVALQVLVIAYLFFNCLFLVFNKKNNNKILLFCFLLLLFNGCYIISTIRNDGETFYSIKKFILNGGFILFAFCAMTMNPKATIRAIHIVLNAYIIVNFFIMVIKPSGLYYSYVNGEKYLSHWFLGAKNNMILYFVPALFFEFVYEKINRHKNIKFFYIILIVCIFSSAIAQSATSLISVIIMGVSAIIYNKKSKLKFINMTVVILLSYILSYLFVSTTYLLDMAGFIGDFFDKEQLLSGRVNIWSRAIELISRSYVWGYGYELDITIITKFNSPYATHCHNLYLDVIYRTGMVGFIVLIISLVYLCFAYKGKKYDSNKSYAVMTMATYTCCMFLMEAYFDLSIFYMFIVVAFFLSDECVFVDKINRNLKEKFNYENIYNI